MLKLLRASKLINSGPNTGAGLRRSLQTSTLRCKWRTAAQTPDVERKLLFDDQLPERYRLVYRAPLEAYVSWTKNVSTATVSILGLVAAYHFNTSMNLESITQKINISMLVSHETDFYYFLAGFALINLAIRTFVAKYPLRIYKSADKYVAVYGSQLPFGTVKHYFDRGQISEYRNVLNPWSHIMYRLGNRSSMLLVDYFKTPSEFHQLFEEK
ncbi:uncharacterized protein LOC117580674 [Drosophila guanche]|uniref:Transmembrane protein 70 homolog, mitochondrial n=1 Tax=Drosophila guanche TaxID=7266 RepID=A0A3B0J744_DROGU|nr:uncharacterized protein LOC117580674 [Drosophila guanche]SPP75692.1 Hypothetical predicted protein [Drosophila guanche]